MSQSNITILVTNIQIIQHRFISKRVQYLFLAAKLVRGGGGEGGGHSNTVWAGLLRTSWICF